MDLKGKTALITGAGRGIGRQIAIDLAKEGVNLVLCSRTEKELAETAKACDAYGVSCAVCAADLSRMQGICKLVQTAGEAFGGVDILVNNAGVIKSDGIDGVSEEDWDLTMAVNVKAPFFLSQKLLPYMREKREGYIINICSTVALGAKPEVTSYSVSKYGMVGEAEALYKDCGEYGVKVSSIYPGVTDTEMLRSQDMPCGPDQWMQPEDISYCVLFLLKSSSRMVVKDVVPWSVGYDKI